MAQSITATSGHADCGPQAKGRLRRDRHQDGQRPDRRLFEAFDDVDLRKQWLPDAELAPRTVTKPKSARYDWEDGTTRVVVGFEPVGDAKSRVALSHERLPDAETADGMKSWWRERLTTLKAQLEGGEVDA